MSESSKNVVITGGNFQNPVFGNVTERHYHYYRVAQDPKESEISKEKQEKSQEKLLMLSYHWEDWKTVLEIKDGLEKFGYRIWIDKEQMTGDPLDIMAEVVENCKIVLMCVSKSYKKSINCKYEAGYIFQHRVPFIPLMVEKGYMADGWLDLLLGTKPRIDFSQMEGFESKLAKLDGEIQRTLSPIERNEASTPSSKPDLSVTPTGNQTESEISKAKQEKWLMLSYQWQYQEAVLQIKDGLEKFGYRIWIDKERVTGDLLDSMANAVENSEIVLMCVSKSYKDSYFCKYEAGYTCQRRTPFIPLMVEKRYKPDGWLGLLLGTKLYIDFSRMEVFESKLAELDTEIKRTLSTIERNEASPSKPDPLVTPTGNLTEPEAKTQLVRDMVDRFFVQKQNKSEISKEKQEKWLMLSYHWRDQETVLQIKDGLEKFGYRKWIDQERITGNPLDNMANAVENSEIVLTCVSKSYNDNVNCGYEALCTFQQKTPCISLIVEKGYKAEGWLGVLLGKHTPCIDFSQMEDFESNLAELDTEIIRALSMIERNEASPSKPDPLITPTGNQTEARANEKQRKHVMISYNPSYQELAVKIRKRLGNRGYRIWIDLEQLTNSTDEARAEAVENAGVMLIFASRKYKESESCHMEAGYADVLDIPWIPLIVEKGYKPKGWLGLLMNKKLYFDFSNEECFESKFEELVTEIERRRIESEI